MRCWNENLETSAKCFENLQLTFFFQTSPELVRPLFSHQSSKGIKKIEGKKVSYLPLPLLQ